MPAKVIVRDLEREHACGGVARSGAPCRAVVGAVFDPGPVARFGAIRVSGRPPFGSRHVATIARFKAGTISDDQGSGIQTCDQPHSAARPTVPISAPAVRPKASGRRVDTTSAAASTQSASTMYSGKCASDSPSALCTMTTSSSGLTGSVTHACRMWVVIGSGTPAMSASQVAGRYDARTWSVLPTKSIFERATSSGTRKMRASVMAIRLR